MNEKTSSDPDLTSVKVTDLILGDMVDLESCPYFHKEPSAKYELATVVHIETETPDCIAIGYEGVGMAGYDVNQILRIRRRELFEPGYFSSLTE